MNISIGILAGGKSSRMGQNKALLQINDKRFIEQIVEELDGFSQTIISAAHPGEYEYLGCDIVYDEHDAIGPIEGIYQVVKNAKEEYVFVCATDMPFVKKELVEYMMEFISNDYDCYVMMDDEHIHPLCAIYSKRVLPVIEELIGNGQYRLMKILDGMRTKYIKLEYTIFEKKVVRNINTQEEYRKMLLPVVFCVSAVKNSGKTSLVVQLIQKFIRDGYSVGVVKHDGHDYVMDHEGTDTDRFQKAGAASTAIYSKNQHSVNYQGSASIEEMIALTGNVDIVIIEGLKESNFPKVEVVRKEISDRCVCDMNTLICVASDVVSEDVVPCPVYGLDDTDKICLCVKNYFGLE